MGITAFIVERKVAAYFFVFLLTVGGVLGFLSLGQLEDPDFTVKKAVVVTRYPGASPEQVELEVTDRIEKAIQELPALDNLISFSRAGLSIIKVEIKEEYWADRLPQVWDEMRKKVRDVTPELPPGAARPEVADDFAFVYGFVLAITGDGFSYGELEKYADGIKKELSLVPGVARVELWGVQDKVVYLDVAESQLSELGLTAEDVAQTLEIQNRVVDAGSIDIQDRRLRVAPTGEFGSPEEIGNLAVRTSLADTLARLTAPVVTSSGAQVVPESGTAVAGARAAVSGTRPGSSELLRIRDVAEVRPGYLEPPFELMRFNGQPALAIYAANVAGGNVVDTGRALDARVAELLPLLPVGIELHKVAWQSDLVTASIDSFMISLLQAIGIVLVVLMVPSGVRMGLIIGSMLIFIILGTFVFMSIFGIDLHRMSLGALIIALGMMVDNSTFVADAMSVRMQRGMDRVKAAVEAASSQAWALLGATIIAVMAFYAIYASPADAGEYCRSLFTVVAIALLLSWLISMTLIPVMCIDVLPDPDASAAAKDPFDTPFFRGLRRISTLAIRNRGATLALVGGLLAAALASYPWVPQMFFPDATRNQLMVDYWAPEGTPVQLTAEGVKPIEAWLANHERVTGISTFIGNGPPRFYLPVDPELPNSSYAQIVVNAHSYADIQPLADELEPWLKANIPVLTRLRKYGVGPSDTWKFEARISGPAEADLALLRGAGERGMAILRESPLAREVRTEMRQPVKKLVPRYNQERGRWATLSRQDVADAIKRAHDGIQVGLYREGDDLYPILLRNVERERRDLADRLDALQIVPQLSVETIPLGQVTDGVGVEWEDPIIHRWNRRRAVSVQASPLDGETFPTLYASVIDRFQELEAGLPTGYDVFWDGEYDSTVDAQRSLLPGVIPGAVIISLIIVLLYNSIRVLACIFLVVPFAAIGIIFGLIALDSPMGFIAILGVLSLVGMMIKNMIVMTGAIRDGIGDGMHPFDACVQASVSQARPIMLAAGTTVLGVLPLFPDPFWNAMATAIMAGLGLGALLTIVLYPTLYAALHGIRPPDVAGSG
jgi:multidrug efflux pump subunit AcrB